jgi:hypothetical protein
LNFVKKIEALLNQKIFVLKYFNALRQAKIRKTFYYGHFSSLNGLAILIFGLKLFLNKDVPKPKRL